MENKTPTITVVCCILCLLLKNIMRHLTEEEKTKNAIERNVKNFMDDVKSFLKEKQGGVVPPEQQCSLLMLETYYRQFLQIDNEIKNLDSIIMVGRYGAVPSPLLACRDKAATQLQQLMKELALTFKSNIKLNLSEPAKDESPLAKILKNKVETRSR